MGLLTTITYQISRPIAQYIATTIAFVLWVYFQYELYFMKGTGLQGPMNTSLILGLSLLLLIILLRGARSLMTFRSLIVFGLGLLCITVGSLFSYANTVVTAGIVLISISLYLNRKKPEIPASSFGYNQTPVDVYNYRAAGPTFSGNGPAFGMQHMHQRSPMNYPLPSNIQGGAF
ncbi:MAG: hypothetical protein CMM25_01800 [Rhodospirillaceae bacterium]|nr:hypothetical protein [Rhodospirillaceae bacterium]